MFHDQEKDDEKNFTQHRNSKTDMLKNYVERLQDAEVINSF